MNKGKLKQAKIMEGKLMKKGKGLLQEFKAFALKGNVIDLAVGVIIGGAFSKIVSSLVSDVIMPLIALLLGKFDFKSIKVTLVQPDPAIEGSGVFLTIGNFIQNIVDFLIIALCIFFAVKLINRLSSLREKEKESAPPPPPEPSKEEKLLTEIRDILKESRETVK